MAIEIEDIVDEESFKEWLNGQPDDVARVLALRIALRTLPNVFSVFPIDDPDFAESIARNLTLQSFRASLISWVARKYPTHDMKSAALSAAHSAANSAARSAALSAANSANSAALSARSAANSAARSAALSAAHSAARSANSAALSARSAALSAANSANPAALSALSAALSALSAAVWEIIQTDASIVLENGFSAVFASPLWPETENQEAKRILRDDAQAQIAKFQNTEEYTALPWGLWVAWWEKLQDDTSMSLFGEENDLKIALKRDEFWDRDVDVVMEELAEIVGWPWGETNKSTSPFSYGWSSTGTVTLTGDAFSAIWVPQNRSPNDAADRLAAAKKAAENLITDLQSGTLQANQAYTTGLRRYVDELPGDVTSSIYVADQELRTLRDDLEDDIKSDFVTDRFARRLLRVIEAHYGLRPYYPDLLNFYDDVRDGRLTEPPPLEAISKLEQFIQEHTPDVFDDSVSESLQRLEPDKVERPPQSDDPQKEAKDAADEQPIELPKDPIADIDPARAEQNAKSAALDKIDSVFSTVEKGAEKAERLGKVGKTYHKVGKPIWDFVKGWYENGGDIPPGV